MGFTDLLYINRRVYRCFVEVFAACTALYSHPQDYYSDLVDSDPVEDSDSDIDLESEDIGQEPLADFEVFLQRRL